MSIADLLAGTEIFGHLATDELEQLASFATAFELGTGEVLFHRGERTDSIFLIDKGRLDVVTRTLSGEVTVGHVGPNEVSGEMALLSGEPRSATLRATETTSGVALGKDVIDSLRRSHRPGGLTISRHLVILACRRMRSRLMQFAGATGDLEPKATRDEHGIPSQPDDHDHIASLPWFAALNDELSNVTSKGRWWAVERGALLVEPGSVPSGILVPTRGALEELLDAGDRRYRVRLAGPGRAAANLGVLDEGRSPTTVRSIERAIVFELPRDVVADLWENDDMSTRALLSAITHDLAGALAAANSPHPWERRR